MGLEEDEVEDPLEEDYYDYEESIISRDPRRRPLFANRRPPYFPPSAAHNGTMTVPGSAPVPVRFGQNFVTAKQMQTALKRVENDVKVLASAIKNLKTSQGGGINAILPLLLLGQSPPQIEKIAFSDTNSAPFNTTEELTLSKTIYKAQKSNLGLILALSMMGDSKDSSSSNALLLAVALGGGI